MVNTALIFWTVLDLFLLVVMFVIASSAIIGYRGDYLRQQRDRPATHRVSLALYAVGFELGLLLPLAATVRQTLTTAGLLPKQLPADATRWLLPVLLTFIVLIAVILTLGLVLDWRTSRPSHIH